MMKKFFEKAAEKKAERLALGKKGFTLIELLAVIAIIAILVLIAAPSFLGYTKDAQVQAMNADAKVLTNAALVFQTEHEEGALPVGEDAKDLNSNLSDLVEKADTKSSGKFAKIDDKMTTEDGNTIENNVQSLKNDIKDYVIDVDTGKVYHKEGVKGKNDLVYFGHGVKTEAKTE